MWIHVNTEDLKGMLASLEVECSAARGRYLELLAARENVKELLGASGSADALLSLPEETSSVRRMNDSSGDAPDETANIDAIRYTARL